MREIIELLSFLHDARVDVDLLQESGRRSRRLQERETPFWRVMMPSTYFTPWRWVGKGVGGSV